MTDETTVPNRWTAEVESLAPAFPDLWRVKFCCDGAFVGWSTNWHDKEAAESLAEQINRPAPTAPADDLPPLIHYWLDRSPETLGDAMRLIGRYTESEGGNSAETRQARCDLFDAYLGWCEWGRPEGGSWVPDLTAEQKAKFEAAARRGMTARGKADDLPPGVERGYYLTPNAEMPDGWRATEVSGLPTHVTKWGTRVPIERIPAEPATEWVPWWEAFNDELPLVRWGGQLIKNVQRQGGGVYLSAWGLFPAIRVDADGEVEVQR